MLTYEFKNTCSNHSVFVHKQQIGVIYLIVYVDDIIITGSDYDDIVDLKRYLSKAFQTKDLGQLRYFLGIDVAISKQGI